MHMAGFRYLGIDATYELLDTPDASFPEIVARLRDGSLNGVNVTMPHKRNAFTAADVIDDAVVRLGAINTLVVSEGGLAGFNTDIDGVRYALSRLGVPTDTPVHVLGSGGAAAAAIVAAEADRRVSMSGRSQQRTVELRTKLACEATVVHWGDVPEGVVVINATPLGMHGERLPPGIVESSIGFIDMAYGDAPTPSISEAEHAGIPHADGLVMLAGQAAGAFKIFTGTEVPVDIMESAARGV